MEYLRPVAYDAGMSTRAERRDGRHGLPARLFLLFALLTGIVAMHGLGPGPLTPASGHTTPAAAPAAHRAAEDHVPAGPCACPDEGGADGHGLHADPTCAAPGTAGAPVLPAPAPAPGGLPAMAAAAHVTAPGSAVRGRAPPSLSELQLLRI